MFRRSAATTAFFLAAAGGLAVYLAVLRQSQTYSVLDHGFRLYGRHALPILGLWAAAFGVLLLVSASSAKRDSEISGLDGALQRRSWASSASPLLLLWLAPALTLDYWSREDLQRRLFYLALIVAAAILYLRIVERAPLRAKEPPPAVRLREGFLGLPLRRRLWTLGAAAALVYLSLAAVFVAEGVTFSGDEPNYLITTGSLIRDGDINLANNYSERHYFDFISKKTYPDFRMGQYAREGRRGRSTLYPINLPGISVLMVPFYALARLAGDGTIRTLILKSSLILWAVLLGLQLYLLARDLWKREGLALGLWALYSFAAPVLFYSVHLYPELPIAFFSVLIYRLASSGRPLSRPVLLLLGVLLGSFFWFGLKYNLIFWPLLAVSLYHLWKSQTRRSAVLWLAAPALIGFALFSYGVWSMYGTLSPFAVYEGVLSAEQARAVTRSFLDLPLSSRVDTFFDYFLDQRDGLFLYAPFYLFALLGLWEMLKRARGRLLGLLAIAGPYLLNYAFFTHRQGYCPQARVLAPISWIGALAVGYFLAHNGNRVFKWLFGAAAAAGSALSLVLIAHPLFLYQPTTHEYVKRAGDVFVHLSSIKLFLPSLLPSFIKIDNAGYRPNAVWIGGIAVFLAAYMVFSGRGRRPLSRHFHVSAAALAAGGAILLWVLHPGTALYPSWPVRYAGAGSLGFYPGPMGPGLIAADGKPAVHFADTSPGALGLFRGPLDPAVQVRGAGEFHLHFPRTYRIVFASPAPLERIKLVFGSEGGENIARMRFFDTPLAAERTIREKKELIFRPAAFYRWNGLFLYEISLALEHLSEEDLRTSAYLLQILPFTGT